VIRRETDVLTPDEVAQRWGVARRTVLELVKRGTLAKLPFRIVRIPRWSVEAVEGGYDDGREGPSGREPVPAEVGPRQGRLGSGGDDAGRPQGKPHRALKGPGQARARRAAATPRRRGTDHRPYQAWGLPRAVGE
jgi:excisionase family DNA binding protein